MEAIREIRIHGRGGMGAVTSAKIIAMAAFYDGKQSQAFPFFGTERRGSPVEAYARISDRPIRVREHVHEPDCVLVLDETLMDVVDVLKGLKKDGLVILNTPEKKKKIDGYSVVCVDALGIAMDVFGRPIVNTPILGAFAKATGLVSLESLERAVKHRFPGELGEKNALAIRRAYEAVEVPERRNATKKRGGRKKKSKK